MTFATMGPKGQRTIPKDVRDRLRLESGDRVEFIVQGNGTAVMVPATLTLADLKGCLPPPKRALSLGELDATAGATVVERASQRRRS